VQEPRAASPAEEQVRAALEELRGKEYTPEEWASVRRNLQALATLIARWNHEPTNSDD
jgi:hypothetical protein